MSRDLTEALRAMMEQSSATNTVPPLTTRGSAAASKSSALLPGAASKGGSGQELLVAGAKTITSTDGIFTLHFEQTLTTTLGGMIYTIPVIAAEPVPV